MRQLVRNFRSNESGATAVEYAIVGLMLSILIFAGAKMTGSKLSTNLLPIANNLE
jgi:pilus assembly protein Flp/PilA